MRVKIAALLSGFFLLLGLWAAPSQAGTGFWSATTCWGASPVNGTWYGYPGTGAEYRSVYSNNQSVLVFGRVHAYFAARGYECGWLGMPFYKGTYSGPGTPYEYMLSVVPYTCHLQITIAPAGSPTYSQTALNYFC